VVREVLRAAGMAMDRGMAGILADESAGNENLG